MRPPSNCKPTGRSSPATADSLAAVLARIRSLRAAGDRTFLLLLRPASMTGEQPPGLFALARGDSFLMFRLD
jgi:hypothetical protein